MSGKRCEGNYGDHEQAARHRRLHREHVVGVGARPQGKQAADCRKGNLLSVTHMPQLRHRQHRHIGSAEGEDHQPAIGGVPEAVHSRAEGRQKRAYEAQPETDGPRCPHTPQLPTPQQEGDGPEEGHYAQEHASLRERAAHKIAAQLPIEVKGLQRGNLARKAHAAHRGEHEHNGNEHDSRQKRRSAQVKDKASQQRGKIAHRTVPWHEKIPQQTVYEEHDQRHVGEIHREEEQQPHGDDEQRRALPLEHLVGAPENKRQQDGQIDEVRVAKHAPKQHVAAEHVGERAEKGRGGPVAPAEAVERERGGGHIEPQENKRLEQILRILGRAEDRHQVQGVVEAAASRCQDIGTVADIQRVQRYREVGLADGAEDIPQPLTLVQKQRVI